MCVTVSYCHVLHICVKAVPKPDRSPVCMCSSAHCWYTLFPVFSRGSVLTSCTQKKKNHTMYTNTESPWVTVVPVCTDAPLDILGRVLIGGAICAHAHAYAWRAKYDSPPQWRHLCVFHAHLTHVQIFCRPRELYMAFHPHLWKLT